MPTHKAPPPQGLETVKASIAGLRKVVEGLEGKAVGSKSSGSKAAIKHATTTASLLFLDLKAANRETLEAVEIVRNSTSTGKQSLDRTRLQLQNVLYEKTHVEKEIRTSKDFKSAYDDAKVGLVAIETFKKEFKKHAEGVDTSVDLDSLDAHALELRRLSHELATRKKLVEQKDALEKKLKLLKRDVATKNSFLSSLRNNLQNVQRSIEPLSKQLSNSESNKVLVYERRIKSKTLPVPMYVLFSSLVAAADSVRESITVDVEGSVADAEALQRKAAAAEEEAASNGGRFGGGDKYRGSRDGSFFYNQQRNPPNVNPNGQPGDWSCPRGCGVVFASKVKCFRCGVDKPE